MPRITPFLWFDNQAEEAARFYTSVFPSSRIIELIRYGNDGPGYPGDVMTVRFELDGQEFLGLNGGPAHGGPAHGETGESGESGGSGESISFVVSCKSQDEVDYFWSQLSAGGEEGSCGWLQDRYGMSWQIVPDRLLELLADDEEERARRVMRAMLEMTKLDIEALERAMVAS